MAASVQNTRRAAEVSIGVVRAFARLRAQMANSREPAHELAGLENTVGAHDAAIPDIIAAVRQLMTLPGRPKRKTGHSSESKAVYQTSRR